MSELPPTYPPPIHPSTPLRTRHIVLAVGLASLIGFGAGAAGVWGVGQLGSAFARSRHLPVGSAPALVPGAGNPGGLSTQGGNLDAGSLAAKVDPAIVDINTTVQTANGSTNAAGTGMILTSTGEVLTNNHVVEGATSISVTIAGRSGTYTAQVEGVDPTADVALIKVKGVSGLPTVSLRDSSTLRVGESVAAIGNALGQGGTPTLTQGEITALDQTITASDFGAGAEQLTGMIETSASIQPGDSGGALVDSSGRVVGMITAGQVQRTRFQFSSGGLGYAVPTNAASSVVSQVRSGRSSSTVFIGEPGYMGVTVGDLDPSTASSLGVTSGVLIENVQSGGPAARAGLAGGVVVTAINGTSVDSVTGLGNLVHAHKPGSKISVTWVDGDGRHTSTLTLIGGPAV